MNKKSQRMVDNYIYRMSRGSQSLYDVYKDPSSSKCMAYARCFLKFKEMSGSVRGSFTIVGSSAQYFSVAYVVLRQRDYYLCYVTYSNSYWIELDDASVEELIRLGIIRQERVVRGTSKEE